MNTDKLVICNRCGGNACYQQHIGEDIITWLDWGCGFTTSTLMVEGSDIVNRALETSPELYKDLQFKDKTGKIWLPATITLPEKGMIFADGTNISNWKWAAVKAIPLQKEDKKISEEQTHKMDMKNIKHFEQRDFMSAAEAIGMFEVN